MGLLRASCFCNCKGPSIRLPVTHCRGLRLDIQMMSLTPTVVVALRSRLAPDSQAAHSHSWLGKQARSCDARGFSQSSKAQAGAVDIAIGVDTEQSMSRSSTAAQPSREDGAVQFEICRISGDGSCLFKALAQGLHQLETGEILNARLRERLTPMSCILILAKHATCEHFSGNFMRPKVSFLLGKAESQQPSS